MIRLLTPGSREGIILADLIFLSTSLQLLQVKLITSPGSSAKFRPTTRSKRTFPWV